MAATSKNYFDILRWINKVIESVENYEQQITARKLIRNFGKRYASSTVEYFDVYALDDKLDSKLKELNEKKQKNESKKVITLAELSESVSRALEQRGTAEQASTETSRPTPPPPIITRYG